MHTSVVHKTSGKGYIIVGVHIMANPMQLYSPGSVHKASSSTVALPPTKASLLISYN